MRSFLHRTTLLLTGISCLWAAACDSKESGPAGQTASSGTPNATPAPAYAGSASCEECHQEIFDEWKTSHHAHAQRELRPELDHPAFDPPREIKHASQTSSVSRDGDRYVLATLGPDRQATPFEPIGALGVSPLWQYLIRFPNGRIQMTELAYDPEKQEWFNVYGDEDRQPHEWGHWTQRGMNWNSMCGTCHTTAFQKNYDPAADSYHSSYLELGVGCESCHGPMKAHDDWQRQYGNKATENTGDPHTRPLEWPRYFQTCMGCHSRRADMTGTYRHGESFSDHFELILPDLSDTFYPDGQVRDEDFEGAVFSLSYMHGQNIRCIDCHGAHTGKLNVRDNSLCLRCHENGIGSKRPIAEEEHGRHPLGKEGSFCYDCHMPLTTYMQRHRRRDHGMTIPDPLLTKEHGIPNACTRCHPEQSIDWAIDTVDEWYGRNMERPTRTRAQLLARLKENDLTAAPDAIGLLSKEANPAWRAVETRFLGAAIQDPALQPSVTAALLHVLEDESPLAQAAAIETLELILDPAGQRPESQAIADRIQNLLASPSRLVRVKAAWALRHRQPWQSPLASPEARKAHADLTEMLTLNQDQPLGAFRWAQYLVDTGKPQESIPWYEKAIRWDPGAPAFRHAYAMTLDALGRPKEALVQAARAAELEPSQPAHLYALGLLYAELDQLPESRNALRAAVDREPRQARYWYNLGLAEWKLRNVDAGTQALLKAEELDPTHPEYPYARATLLVQVGQLEQAREAARRALQIDPQHAPAQALLSELSTLNPTP